MLSQLGNMDSVYWICAFSVNQHSSICGMNLDQHQDPVTGIEHPTCPCGMPKALNATYPLDETGKSISCELNKFDCMMSYLAHQSRLQQVIAVDVNFDLFQRAWCLGSQWNSFPRSSYFEMRLLGASIPHTGCGFKPEPSREADLQSCST